MEKMDWIQQFMDIHTNLCKLKKWGVHRAYSIFCEQANYGELNPQGTKPQSKWAPVSTFIIHLTNQPIRWSFPCAALLWDVSTCIANWKTQYQPMLSTLDGFKKGCCLPLLVDDVIALLWSQYFAKEGHCVNIKAINGILKNNK